MVPCIKKKNNIYNEYYDNPSAFYQWHLSSGRGFQMVWVTLIQLDIVSFANRESTLSITILL